MSVPMQLFRVSRGMRSNRGGSWVALLSLRLMPCQADSPRKLPPLEEAAPEQVSLGHGMHITTIAKNR
jgi:hypothetical protein